MEVSECHCAKKKNLKLKTGIELDIKQSVNDIAMFFFVNDSKD